MSTKYQRATDVPTEAIIKRLEELSDAIIGGKETTSQEFTMRIPAELDRDPDLVLSIAATRLKKLDRIESVINRYRELNGCYPGNKFWSHELSNAFMEDN